MTDGNRYSRLLVMTVGTGDIADLENTLIVPMLKSIESGEWQKVVLLPSQVSETWALKLRERVANASVDIRPLPEPGQENNADACFGHFDQVLGELMDQGLKPHQIVVDFTRGTKAMSAALVLAAVRRDIPMLRYVHGERRDERGMVVPGTETVGELETSLVILRKRLDAAADLIRHGDFGAVATIIPEPNQIFTSLWPVKLQSEAKGLRIVSELYAAWDRFDYHGSIQALDRLLASDIKVPQEFRPSEEVVEWLKQLADESDPSDMPSHAERLRVVACDMLANAERRLRDRHMEDALIRAYRTFELVGQCRLFDKGHNSASIDPNDPDVCQFRGYLRKKNMNKKNKSQDFGRSRQPGKLTAPRHLTARFLKFLKDPLAARLLEFDHEHTSINAENRNRSILVHGFTAKAPSEVEPLQDLIKNLERLLIEDDRGAVQRLAVARQLDFKRSH